MCEGNIELLRRWNEAFNARDIEALIAYCDPGIEYRSVFAAADGALYRGHEGMRRWQHDLEEAWGKEIRVEPEAYFDLGEHALAFFMYHARGRQSGAEVVMPATTVFRSRGDLVVYIKAYVHREDALRDLGASEDELEPIAP
jgi:ketosteroid isomerase-like protein